MPLAPDRGQTRPVSDTAPADPALYGRSFAEVYDRWYLEEAEADRIATVLDAVAPLGDVLELGAGTGSIAGRLTTPGTVVALDASVEMLARLSNRRPLVALHADMAEVASVIAATPEVPTHFDLVFCSHNTLLNLTSRHAQQQCLTGVAAVLDRGGMFVIELVVPDSMDALPRHSVTPSRVRSDGPVFIETRVDPDSGLLHGAHIEITDGAVIERPWTVLPIPPETLDAMAMHAGLDLESEWADWQQRPYDGGGVRIATFRRR